VVGVGVVVLLFAGCAEIIRALGGLDLLAIWRAQPKEPAHRRLPVAAGSSGGPEGGLQVYLVDPSGDAIEGMEVSATAPVGGKETSRFTGSDGQAHLPGPGPFALMIHTPKAPWPRWTEVEGGAVEAVVEQPLCQLEVTVTARDGLPIDELHAMVRADSLLGVWTTLQPTESDGPGHGLRATISRGDGWLKLFAERDEANIGSDRMIPYNCNRKGAVTMAVTLEPTVTVATYCVDAVTGSPIRSCSMNAIHCLGTNTQSDGIKRFNVDPNEGLEIEVFEEGYQERTVALSGDRADIVIALEPD
jgi:hypothetical protein